MDQPDVQQAVGCLAKVSVRPTGMRCGVALRLIVALLSCIQFIPCFAAEKFALLVGIDEYAPPLPRLEGPRNDALALRDILTSRWGFSRANIEVLLGADGTRLGIINAMTSLMAKTKSGDIVFVYFAGHGTSAENRGLRVPLPHTTGAIVPVDFRMGDSRSMLGSLIVGRRDIRPALEALDRGGRHVFVAIDACFSGNTVRGRDLAATGRPRLPTRQIDVAFDVDAGAAATPAADSEYPYKNVVYISAAAENEQAGEISGEFLKFYPTRDGKAHGAFTDALLRALAGELSVHASGAAYYQLHAAIRSFMEHAGYQQSPQLLPLATPGPDWEANLPLFGSAQDHPPPDTAASTAHILKVSTVGIPKALAGELGKVDGIQLTRDRADFAIVAEAGNLKLLTAGGDAIVTATASNYAAILQSLKQQIWLARLGASAGRVREGLALEFADDQLGATRVGGTQVGFRVVSEKPAYLVIVNVDPRGAMRVLYPAFASEVVQSPPHRVLSMNGIDIVAPYGVESIVALGFDNRPTWLDAFVGKEMPGNSPTWEAFAFNVDRQVDRPSIAVMRVVTAP